MYILRIFDLIDSIPADAVIVLLTALVESEIQRDLKVLENFLPLLSILVQVLDFFLRRCDIGFRGIRGELRAIADMPTFGPLDAIDSKGRFADLSLNPLATFLHV